MTYDSNTSVQSRVINAFFDTKGAAQQAIDDLVAAGIPREHISETGGGSTGVTTTAVADHDKGFWDSLKDLFLPDEDRTVYAEGLRRGGFLVSVRADEANYTRVLDILDTDGAVDLDEREGQWRSEGWSGSGFGTTGAAAGLVAGAGFASPPATSVTGLTQDVTTDTSYRTDTAARAASLGTAKVPAASTHASEDDVVKVYEEELKVGKRDVNHGRVRLRSYVVETPVNEQISLRNEQVFVDRKAVDRPVSADDVLFQDRTIELEEHAEEAVISKEARVKEEISLRKTSEDRVQTVTDSVRRTEVEIDDGRKVDLEGSVTRFSAATDAVRIVEHMDVISADGQKIGTVDHLDGPDHIKLAKSTSPDGQHHLVPFTWIDHVDQHVHLNKTLADIKEAS